MKRLILNSGAHDYSRHETQFLKNLLDNSNPYDEDELSEAQKDWLLKLNKKYK